MMTESLVGPRIELRALRVEDADALAVAASDGELWKLPFTVVPNAQTVQNYIETALAGQSAGTVAPFAICLRETGAIIGSTRFWKMDFANRKLEIGHTWIARSWQRTFVNTETKYLLLSWAFEKMNCIRVQFTTDERNIASRAAILRLGAREEGVIRHERIMPDGHKRNAFRFSILDDEWPNVRTELERRLE